MDCRCRGAGGFLERGDGCLSGAIARRTDWASLDAVDVCRCRRRISNLVSAAIAPLDWAA